jgi:hypothetical protein
VCNVDEFEDELALSLNYGAAAEVGVGWRKLCRATTNLGVKSSSLFGRAPLFNELSASLSTLAASLAR